MAGHVRIRDKHCGDKVLELERAFKATVVVCSAAIIGSIHAMFKDSVRCL